MDGCGFIGVGAPSTLGGTKFLPEKYVLKISKMPEFYLIINYQNYQNYQNIRIFMIFARKIYKIHEFCMIFARKMPEFYIITARKIFPPEF